MTLKKIVIRDFRNHTEGIYSINPAVTVIIGENAKGKTNILEAVYFLINGAGFRESKEEELVQMEKNQTTVEGKFEDGRSQYIYKIHLSRKDRIVEKHYFVQKTKKSHHYYLSNQTRAILFEPQQIEIITGSPDARRSYINTCIFRYDPEYKKRLIHLESAIRRRNKIFEQTKDEQKLKNELVFWNSYIIEQSVYIIKKRKEYVAYLNSHPLLDHKEFAVMYHKNEATPERFADAYEHEKRLRKTYIGPQKDDFEFFIKNPSQKNVQHYGSRSEQRLVVFWLKMNEITYFEDVYRKKPILLLDDVFSEFDKANKRLILSLIRKYQTILTTTEEEIIDYIDTPKTVIEV